MADKKKAVFKTARQGHSQKHYEKKFTKLL